MLLANAVPCHNLLIRQNLCFWSWLGEYQNCLPGNSEGNRWPYQDHCHQQAMRAWYSLFIRTESDHCLPLSLRDEWRYQNRCWPPPPHFRKIMSQFFSQKLIKKPCLKVQNLQHNFLDWKCLPPPLKLFRNVSVLVSSPVPHPLIPGKSLCYISLFSGCYNINDNLFG